MSGDAMLIRKRSFAANAEQTALSPGMDWLFLCVFVYASGST